MTGLVQQVAGQFLEYPGSLERFSERDTNDGSAAVPLPANATNLNLVALTGADMLESIDIFVSLRATFNAFTGTLPISPFFPYNFIQNLRVPYQSGSLTMGSMDGHLWWLTNVLRNNNHKWTTDPYIQQIPDIATAYTPATYQPGQVVVAPVASANVAYDFNLKVIPAMYFDRFYDMSADGKMIRFDDTFVSPFLMSSTGRNVIPSITLNPIFGTRGDLSPYTRAGSQATPATWTDTGSSVKFRRNGWRQPVNAALMPPLFNWAHQWFVQRNQLGTSRVQIPIPTEGQLLCVIIRLFDPTAAAGVGAPIDISTLSKLKLTYGSGLNKFDDDPNTMQDRFIRQHGANLTSGVGIWDLYADTKSNVDAINTYTTASPIINLDFGTVTPAATTYVDVAMEFLTLVGN